MKNFTIVQTLHPQPETYRISSNSKNIWMLETAELICIHLHIWTSNIPRGIPYSNLNTDQEWPYWCFVAPLTAWMLYQFVLDIIRLDNTRPILNFINLKLLVDHISGRDHEVTSPQLILSYSLIIVSLYSHLFQWK